MYQGAVADTMELRRLSMPIPQLHQDDGENARKHKNGGRGHRRRVLWQPRPRTPTTPATRRARTTRHARYGATTNNSPPCCPPCAPPAKSRTVGHPPSSASRPDTAIKTRSHTSAPTRGAGNAWREWPPSLELRAPSAVVSPWDTVDPLAVAVGSGNCTSTGSHRSASWGPSPRAPPFWAAPPDTAKQPPRTAAGRGLL